jgi:putative membrane protein
MTRNFLKLAFPTVALTMIGLSTALTNSSCNSDNKENRDTLSTTESSESKIVVAADTVGAKMERAADRVADIFSNNNNPDSAFLADAISSNEAEVQLLQLGVDKGSDAGLKSDARHMITDHKTLIRQLRDYARMKNYPVPMDADGKGADHLDDLRNKDAGKDWDQKWADIMVDEHDKAIKDFEKASDKVKETSLKNKINAALPTLRHHREMMQMLKDKLK